ncbi:MAG TPA: endonuclease/exonuclease/phosphatase family protein [Dictyobacter sp.]|nr:endonuclease/exonuclease/phosphatase family protein [Dictyobacter sp.]
MTRIISYNILAGGYNMGSNSARRTQQIVTMLRSMQPDIVGLPEAIHPQLHQKPLAVEEIAEALGMQFVPGPGGVPGRLRDYQLGMMTRLPIVYTKIHERPGIMLRPLLEVCVEEEDGQHLTVFVTHLSAAFNRGRAGGHIRVREVQEILRIMEPHRQQGLPHLIMGDMNSLAPGEAFKASELLKYVVSLDIHHAKGVINDGHPHLNGVVPPRLRFLKPFLRMVAQNDYLCSLFDMAAYYYAPRKCIGMLMEHYEDSFRRLHPQEYGFTCPAAAPAGRIDYIFASASLVTRLAACMPVTGTPDMPGHEASDHLPMFAEFGLSVQDLSQSSTQTGDADRAATHS